MTDGIASTTAATLDQAYDEAMAMLVEARDFAKNHKHDMDNLEADERLRMSQYTMQVTARLTQVMAWLMASKAVANGELSTADLNRDYALPQGGSLPGADPEMLEREKADRDVTPNRLADLMDRSRNLYQRIARLDQKTRAAS
ncbi:MAG: DUF1465 family protein [Pseudomonadota bacterium]